MIKSHGKFMNINTQLESPETGNYKNFKPEKSQENTFVVMTGSGMVAALNSRNKSAKGS